MNAEIGNNPFVGLRPFESAESLLFFGRQEQTMELLLKLHQHHFVGVVGSSGSGKSSLIRAGLIPRLKAGYLVNERDRWLAPIFKPGEEPLCNFATALLNELQNEPSNKSVSALVQKIKEEGADAIVELLQPILNEKRTNIFILVDQFEELFRFSIDTNDAAKKDEAIDFVNILLELSGQAELPVYVVITMRSDFIGECSRFFGLPEALNQSQYLVPRLTRVQLKNAVEGPVRLYGGKINPALTSRLLNDIQTVKDELPLLQHLLMRTWDYEMKTDKKGELHLEDYTAVGGIEKALSMHADEALAGMNEEQKHIAKLMFQALTTTDYGGRKIRRPARLSELAKLTGGTTASVTAIIDHFNEDKRSFLVVNKTADTNDPLIDISHESLIRQWETLKVWVDEETDSAKTYLRLSEAAVLNKEGKKDLISGTELQVASNWRNKHNPNATWAGRYNETFEGTIAFLEKSRAQFEADKKEKERQQKRQLRRTRTFSVIISILAIGAFIAAFLAFQASTETKEQRKITSEISTELMSKNKELLSTINALNSRLNYIKDSATTLSQLSIIKEDIKETSKQIEAVNIPDKSLQQKYAQLLQVPAESITNGDLYKLIDKNIGRFDIDASSFAALVLGSIYNVTVEGNSQNLFDNYCSPTSENSLKEGDLVFFSNNKSLKSISAVGIYLQNRMFVAKTSSKGINIMPMDDRYYWKERFVTGAKLDKKQSTAKAGK